jgi:hypothetical protein
MFMQLRRITFRLAVLALLAIPGCAPLWAQTVTGSIRGSVVDQTGASLPDAQITARNVNTGVVTTTVTDHSGEYNIQTLPIGTYVISAKKTGFKITANQPFSLEIDQIARIDLKLEVGEVTTTISVAADSGSILQTEDASLGTTITSNMLESMPLPGQNFSAATVFVPGAVLPTYSSLGTTQGTERDTSFASSTQPSFNGNRMQTNNYIFDGTDINEPLQNTIAYNPAPEAIGQMRIITGNADAEYGNVNGGEIIAVTKAGTNKFHGSVFEFYENQNWQANSWANGYNKTNKSNFHQSQFGATFGGPVFKNKLFFFADFEGFRNTTAGASTPVSVPSLRMRKGDFSEFLGAPTLDYNQTIPQTQWIQFFNTTAGNGAITPYVNDQLPINNPTAEYIFAHPEFYPLPNRASTNSNSPDTNNYLGYSKTAYVNNQGDIRVDYVMSQKDNMWARFTHGGSLDDPIVSYLSFQFPSSSDYPFWNGVLNEVHTFTPNLQNEFRAGYSRIRNLSGVPFDSTGLFPAGSDSKVGIPYASPYPGFTETNISSAEKNYGTLGVVQNTIDNVFDYGDTVTWLHGNSIFKAGTQVLRYQENYYYPGNTGTMGEFAYNGEFTKNLNAPIPTGYGAAYNGGYGFADVVIDASEYSAVNGVTGRVGQRQYRLAFFAEDEWKVTPKLTLNIGLRYGYDQPFYEVNNKEANLDLTKLAGCTSTNQTCIEYAGQNGNSRALYDSFYKEFMPRLSFAWQLNSKQVLRGGYAITDDFEGMGAAQRLTENPPFIPAYQYTALQPTATTPGTPISVTKGFTGGTVSSAFTKYNVWDKNIKPELIQQYNLTLQTAMGPHFTWQVGYVGNVAQHLVVPEGINQYTTPGNSATAPLASLVGTSGQVYYTTAEGYSNYNAMQIQLRQRTWHGLESTFNYTWSKNMTNNPGYFGIGGVDGPSVYPQNAYNPHADYGVSGFDTRNAASFVGTYAIPFGHGRDYGRNVNRFVDWAIGGWKVSLDAVMYSGFPITIGSTNNSNSNNTGGARANQYRKLRVVNRSLAHWFGTDPSAVPCGATDNHLCAYGAETTNSFGTAHVGTERAPGYRVIDTSTFKQFRTYKEQYIQFRVDAFNVGNIASYSAPGSTATTTSTFGQITSTLSPARQLQMSLKYEF